MDFLLKYATWRNLIIVCVVIAAGFAVDPYIYPARQKFLDWRYPAQKGDSVGGREILMAAEKRKAHSLRFRYDEVMTKLQAAHDRGFEVAGLANKCPCCSTT